MNKYKYYKKTNKLYKINPEKKQGRKKWEK